MRSLILAAGYATRLYPLTLTQPKPLLPVAGKPMIDYVMDNLAPIGGIDEVFVVSNAKFAGHFSQWSEAYRQASNHPFRFSVINDGSTDDSNKLGAIGDLNLVLEREGLDDDLIVVAGDNLFNQSLQGFGDYCRSQNGPVLGVYDSGSRTGPQVRCRGHRRDRTHHELRREAGRASQRLDRDRNLFLPAPIPVLGPLVHRRGQQSGSAGSIDPVALSAHAGDDLERSRYLVRYRIQENPGRGQSDLFGLMRWSGGAKRHVIDV